MYKKLIQWILLGYWTGDPIYFIYLSISELFQFLFSLLLLNTAVSTCEAIIANKNAMIFLIIYM